MAAVIPFWAIKIFSLISTNALSPAKEKSIAPTKVITNLTKQTNSKTSNSPNVSAKLQPDLEPKS